MVGLLSYALVVDWLVFVLVVQATVLSPLDRVRECLDVLLDLIRILFLLVDFVDETTDVDGVLERLAPTDSTGDRVRVVVLLLAVVVERLLHAAVVGRSLVAHCMARKLRVSVGSLGSQLDITSDRPHAPCLLVRA